MSALGVVTHKVRLWWLGSLGAGTLLGFVAFSLELGGDAVLPVETTPTVVRLISSVTGWTYFVCWSVSFWPQVGTYRGCTGLLRDATHSPCPRSSSQPSS